MTYVSTPSKVEGGQREVVSSDDDTQQLLLSILKELKKMNVYLSTICEDEVKNEDIEV